MSETASLPLLPLRNAVCFPFVIMPVSVGRPESIAAVEAALDSEDKKLAVFTLRDAGVERPGQENLFPIGTTAVIKRMARVEEGLQVLLQGGERIRLTDLPQSEPFLKANFEPAPLPAEESTELEAQQRQLLAMAGQVQEITQVGGQIDVGALFSELEDPMQLVYMLAAMIDLEFEKAQKLLESPSRAAAMRFLINDLAHEIQVLKLQKRIASQTQSELGKEQREYYLRRQMRAIQDELGEGSPEEAEVADLRRQLDEIELPEAVRTEAERVLNRLERLSAQAPDFQITRSYLELILELPWTKKTDDHLDLARARKVLDEDHYGLEEIKERILEQLAVLKLNPKAKAPILCFVGPPGVGKTSLGKSIARSLGRRFERLSLGGLHDESELRGHRRTYIGAMPGRIIQSMRRAEVNNPLLMLDEIDKLGRDFRGDPASALLEILDPAQNDTFRDNYLDLPFDLSRVFFITTANALDPIPRPLLDRMEIIHLSGYSDEEKLEIGKRYLLDRQRSDAGLTAEQFQLPDETLLAVINRYTREAGVREFERMLGRLARKVALKFAEGQTEPVTVQPEDLIDLLGSERFFLESVRDELPPGVATGLAWTPTGGDVLYVEAIELASGDKVALTGQLGNVMKESAQAAHSYIIARASELGFDPPTHGVHLHVPAGAIPKDGPSAGVTIATALASLYSGHVVQADTAMTGEITLSGLVLPVGGIKEKVLAARRAGIKRIILPQHNEKDLRDIPEKIREEMEFVLARRIEDVLQVAIPELAREPVASAE